MSDSALGAYGLQQRFSEMMRSRGQFKLDSSVLVVPSRINTTWCLWQTMARLANVGKIASGIGSCRSGKCAERGVKSVDDVRLCALPLVKLKLSINQLRCLPCSDGEICSRRG
jgi:hypothetical protein